MRRRQRSSVIVLKSADEIARMREAGRVVARVLAAMAAHVAPGVRTCEFDAVAREVIFAAGAKPSFLNLPSPTEGVAPFPAAVVVSVNEQVVHGVPGERVLGNGDLVSLDSTCIWKGYHADAAITVPVGKIAPEAEKLMLAARDALAAGIQAVRPGAWLWDVIGIIQDYIESRGYGIVREYQGHGIGRAMHEEPSVPNYLDDRAPPNVRLQAGMTMALEPMITAGDWHTKTLADGWTVATTDGSLAAHFEHTLAVTAGGVEILTQAA